jgi:hypothetical protein
MLHRRAPPYETQSVGSNIAERPVALSVLRPGQPDRAMAILEGKPWRGAGSETTDFPDGTDRRQNHRKKGLHVPPLCGMLKLVRDDVDTLGTMAARCSEEQRHKTLSHGTTLTQQSTNPRGQTGSNRVAPGRTGSHSVAPKK